MKSNGKEFEDIFRDAFEHAELVPSSKVWERIEQEVAKKPRVIMMPKLKQIGIAAAIALFALSTSYFGYHYFNPTSPVVIENTTTTAPTVKPDIAAQTPGIATPQPDRIIHSDANNLQGGNDGQPPVSLTETVPTGKNHNSFVAGMRSPNTGSPVVTPFTTAPDIATEKTGLNFLPLSDILSLPVESQSFSKYVPTRAAFVAIAPTEDIPSEATASRRGWVGLMVARNEFNPGFSRVSNVQPTPFIDGQYAEASVIHNDLTDSLLSNRSVALQIDGGYFITRKLAIRSGLIFTRNAYSVNSSAELILPPFLQGSGAKANTIDVNTQLISIPLQLAYISEGKFGYQLSAGISGDLALSHSIRSSRVEGVQYNFGDYKPFNISGIAGVGIFYNFTQNVGVHLDVNYRRGLTSTYQTPHLQAYPQWISLGGGLLYKF